MEVEVEVIVASELYLEFGRLCEFGEDLDADDLIVRECSGIALLFL